MRNNINVSASDLVSAKPKKYLYVPPMIYLNIIKSMVTKPIGGPDNGFAYGPPS